MQTQKSSLQTISYTVRFPEPHTHYAEIEATIPVTAPVVELFMPVWTPGSYLIREFSRHVENVTVAGLSITKSRKNRWRIETGGASEIHLSYRVYCREMSVRTNWVEDSFALLNGAPTFLTLADAPPMNYEVWLDLPAAWSTTATGLTEIGTHRYAAPDYDTLVDSPIVAGSPSIHRFEVDGIPHSIVTIGDADVWDGYRTAADVETIVRQYRKMWGSLPYEKYVFLNLLTEARGGLEHKNSMCIMTSRWATATHHAYLDWVSLVSHEFLHVWNVKRLRPIELGPFDYERENYTQGLWIAEGFTNYYDDLTVHRAGLSTRDEYLGDSGLSRLIQSLQTTPGRLVSSAQQASFDAWIKLYRPDENTGNTTISYYTKGAVIAWLLDARIRRSTNGMKSLDDLMRLAYERYSGERGFTPEEFQRTAEEVAGASLDEFLGKAAESTEELDYAEALDWFGLRFRKSSASTKSELGAETKNDAGRLVVTKVPRETPAFHAGLNVDDEIIALNDFRIRADQFSKRLENYRPGDNISLLVARRDKLTRLDLTFSAEPPQEWHLEVTPDATADQTLRLNAWLV